MTTGSPSKRVLYVQYTNPGGYPPLEHGSRILADAGWKVLFLGTGAFGAGSFSLPPHPNITVERLETEGLSAWGRKLHFLRFCCWVLAWAIRWKPALIYASDLYATPAAFAVSLLGVRVIYHEHDSPSEAGGNRFHRFCLWCRRSIARRALMNVLPNASRAEAFRVSTGTSAPVRVVWNCPSAAEVETRRYEATGGIRILYHGSIVPERVPLVLIDVVAGFQGRVKLVVAGYETVGSAGYVDQLRRRAEELGCAGSFEYAGKKVFRKELLDVCRSCDIGLALMPMESTDINMRHMAGASNKPFDYLACGLSLIVSDLDEWKELFVDNGYALTCHPGDASSIRQAIQWYVERPERMREMGSSGQARIASEWNYETLFRPVFEACEGRAAC